MVAEDKITWERQRFHSGSYESDMSWFFGVCKIPCLAYFFINTFLLIQG